AIRGVIADQDQRVKHGLGRWSPHLVAEDRRGFLPVTDALTYSLQELALACGGRRFAQGASEGGPSEGIRERRVARHTFAFSLVHSLVKISGSGLAIP